MCASVLAFFRDKTKQKIKKKKEEKRCSFTLSPFVDDNDDDDDDLSIRRKSNFLPRLSVRKKSREPG